MCQHSVCLLCAVGFSLLPQEEALASVKRLLGWWAWLQHQNHIGTCTQHQCLFKLDAAVHSGTFRNVISRLAQRCRLSDTKCKGQVFIAWNVSLVCPGEFCTVLCVLVLAGEVPLGNISVTQTYLTFPTPCFMQVLQAHSSAICPCHE